MVAPQAQGMSNRSVVRYYQFHIGENIAGAVLKGEGWPKAATARGDRNGDGVMSVPLKRLG
jgi:hypothetical protein